MANTNIPSQYRFTDNTKDLFKSRTASLNSLYCREDFEQAIRKVEDAQPDAKPSRRAELARMCRQANVASAEELLRDRKLLDDIPTRQELMERLPEVLYELRGSFPSPSDYMARIVYLLAPEYRDDPTRLAILKRFVEGAGFHCATYPISAIEGWAEERMTEEARQDYLAAEETDRMRLLLPMLTDGADGIFSDEHLKATLSPADTLRLLGSRLRSCAESSELLDKDENALRFSDPPLSEDTAALLRAYCAARQLPAPPVTGVLAATDAIPSGGGDDGALADLVSGLERDAAAQMKQWYFINRNGKKKKIYELYKDSKKDRKETLLRHWNLLRIANELASGAFKMSGATRLLLYHFAIMFHMTVGLTETNGYDESFDFVKNLFEDYYHDNLARFLSGGYTADPRYASQFEREPTGEGVNYKNFVEVIYLYYLCRRDLDLSPGQRIDRAAALVRACVKSASGRKGPPKRPYADITNAYSELFTAKLIGANEDKLQDLILEHFPVLPENEAEKGSGILVFSNESTASIHFMRYSEDLLSNCPIVEDYGKGMDLKPLFTDARFTSDRFFDWKLAGILKRLHKDDPAFVRMVDQLESRLTEEFQWIGARRKGFLAELLHLLYHSSSKEKPLMIDAVTTELRRSYAAVTGAMVLDGVEALREMGFDVGREMTEHKNKRSQLWLGSRTYEDESLKKIMEGISSCYRFTVSDVTPLLEQKIKIKIGRTRLIAALASYYVSELDERPQIDSLQKLVEDFTEMADPVLRDCRYQTISEKNILDMFVLFSLYYYMIENRFGESWNEG